MGEPGFSGTWANQSPTTNATTAFYRDPQGVVHLKGLPGAGGNNTSIFTLPAGYRPSKTLIFPGQAIGSTQIGTLTINASGTVVPFVASTASGVPLDEVDFRACGAPGAEVCP
jgi:hypothetical protein